MMNLDHFGIEAESPDLSEWEELIKRADASREHRVKIALVGKYVQLEDAYTASAKLYDVVPFVTKTGVEAQIREAVSRKPGFQLRFEDMVDESIVGELEKSGFIDKVYKQ